MKTIQELEIELLEARILKTKAEAHAIVIGAPIYQVEPDGKVSQVGKPDRRAELLELVRDLATTDPNRGDVEARASYLDADKAKTLRYNNMMGRVIRYHDEAAAILDAVDRSVGATPENDYMVVDDIESLFEDWWIREGNILASRNPTHQSQHDIAKAAWEAARR